MELPAITSSGYSSSSIDHTLLMGHAGMQAMGIAQAGFNPKVLQQVSNTYSPVINQPKEQPVSNARIVKVFIADSNENLPLEKRVLYSGDEKLTDLTDQELFFDVPMVDLLAKHNALRATVVDKKQAEKFGRDIMLEPARIRDLKMVVVTVAQF